MTLDILSVGMVNACGRGSDRLAAALRAPVREPDIWSLPRLGLEIPVRRVDDQLLQDPVLHPARRAGRMIKMAMLAASDCLAGVALSGPERERLGLVLATGMGPHEANFGFVSGLLKFGLDQGSPSLFSHSVHNAPLAYIAAMAGAHGPAVSLTHFAIPFHQALGAARLWLDDGTCDHVLVGAADELGGLMLAMYARKGLLGREQVLRPGTSDGNLGFVPGEGATFFLLSRPGSGARRLGHVRSASAHDTQPNSVCMDHDGLWSSGAEWTTLYPGRPTCCHNAIWGGFPGGSGVALAACLSLLGAGEVHPMLLHTNRQGAEPLWITP